MFTMNYCPACYSMNISVIKKHRFVQPGDDIQNNLNKISYERLWILFNKIIKDQKEYVFKSCLCANCGLIFINPRLSDEDIKIKYDTINELGGVKERLMEDRLVRQEERSLSIFHTIDYYIKDFKIQSPKILDFGGASGYILQPFAKKYDCNIIDFEQWDLPDGIKYLGTNLNAIGDHTKFDAILLLHTLEHITYPKELIEELCSKLPENGLLYVEVPLGTFQEWRFINDPITHVNFFSEESLSKLFKSCGLNVLHLTTAYQRVTRAKTWCLNILGCKNSRLKSVSPAKILSTKQQMNKLYYYIPFIFHERAYKKIFNKIMMKRGSQTVHF